MILDVVCRTLVIDIIRDTVSPFGSISVMSVDVYVEQKVSAYN